MKVHIDDRVFLIEFVHGIRSGVQQDQNYTHCLIRDGSASLGSHRELAPVLASGTAVRHFRDQPNREVGRKGGAG